MKKIRLDQLLVEKGMAESREKAKRLILAGKVLVDGHNAPKPGYTLAPDHKVVLKEGERFVSRGGEKLEGAMQAFPISLEGKVCLDIGSSTGGFTDCMLQHGAVKVYAVDVGKGQLHWKLREDPRVVVMESVNARYLTAEDFPEQAGFASIDTSFISLTNILPAVKRLLKPGGKIVSLIKPQFEAGKTEVDKGRGVITDPAIHETVISNIREFGTKKLGLEWIGLATSPIKGPKGNVEFLAYWNRP
ncbi:MAG: rRNA (cytidine1920-2-O)/16S rRNA (cytidine1409-2-O)-methyltransferase [Verrucomicrobiota bacterium]|nr:rRNA (cytidine1920-2-O)/16S rRNA (cytidine1409-2-O)-methyltransferase [Verrucomicrobiota bacterium]